MDSVCYFCKIMENDINKLFGGKVVEMRKQHGLTQEELSFKCGIHRTYMGTIERGEKSVTLDTVAKIATGLGVEVKELFDFLSKRLPWP